MKRSNDHIIAGIGFIALASFVGFALFFVTKPSDEAEDVKVADAAVAEEVVVTDAAAAEEIVNNDQTPEEQAQSGNVDAPPVISAAWLVGTWGPAHTNPGNDPAASCDTDVLIKFNANGTYSDLGSEGRYSTNGRTIRYFDRRTVQEMGEDPEEVFVPEPIADISGTVTALDKDTFDEDGDRWRRCRSS